MRESLDEPVSVLFYYDAKKNQLKPHALKWNGRDFRLGPIDFHHITKKGARTIHHFSMTDVDESAYFKIALDTSDLRWSIEEYMYGGDASVHYA